MTRTQEQERRKAELDAARKAFVAAADRYLEALNPSEEEREDAVIMAQEDWSDWTIEDTPGFSAWLAENVEFVRDTIDEEVTAELRTGWTVEMIAEALGHSEDAVRASVARIQAEQAKAE